jgi:hemoglobin/transferrin/lactoferrin receptor protein
MDLPPAVPIETIVVTAVASRVPEAIAATPATVSVISREALDRGLARDIRDAFRYEPGVSVDFGGTRFGLGNINIRGLDGNRVQYLQDGVRLPDNYKVGSFSNASRNPYDAALLQRIEVMRGPGSALYGSDALAGVVALTTIDPRDVLVPRARAGAFVTAGYTESDRSMPRAAALAADAGPLQVLLAVSASDGHERDNHGDVDSLGATRTTPNPQDSHESSQLFKVVVPAADGGRWRATLDQYDNRVATDVRSLNPQSPRTVSLTGDDRASRRRLALDGLHYGLGPLDTFEWTLYGQDAEVRQATEEVRANTTAQCLSAAGSVSCRREALFRFSQRESGLTAIGRRAWGENDLVAGLEWSRGEVEESRDGRQTNLDTGTISNVVGTDAFPTRDFPRSTTTRWGVFTQDTFRWQGASLIPALRYDRFETVPRPDAIYGASNPTRVPVAISDDAWSPKLGVLVPFGQRAQLTVQAATGFRAPPYFDANIGLSNLPLGYTVIPNPDLKPETSRGLEVGMRGRLGSMDYAMTAYRTDYRDLIVSRAPLPCPGDPRCVAGASITFQSQNVTRARIEGLEARVEAPLADGLRLRAGAAASKGDDESRNVPLNSVDPAKAVAGLAWDEPAKRYGGELHVTHAWRKSRIDMTGGTLYPTPAYTTLDLTAHAKLGAHVEVNAGIFNVTEQKYWLWSDVRGIVNPAASVDRYTQPGRTLSVQVKATF